MSLVYVNTYLYGCFCILVFMRRDEALRRLANADASGLYVYRKQDLSIVLGESRRALDRTVCSLAAGGVLERATHGVYVFPLSRHVGAGTLDDIVRCLRPGRVTWESCESALSQWGVISQIPVGRTTYMTTGREGEFHTRFGVIDLTHSKLAPSRIIGNLVYRGGRLPIATKRFAYDNLRSTGRNVGLIDMDELEDDDEW